ncbi:MAG: GntR family transcriptional regulator [Desulfobacteraceae bacterium]|nr:GntR family transcriptional regulator [Desulfobacteraceae bacterium]
MKNRLADQAYEIIQRQIISLELAPGQQIDEKQLAELIGIGRTPVREALLKLTSEYLVESQPQKGFVVTHLTFQNTKSIFEALRILEMGIAELAVQQELSDTFALMQGACDQFESAMAGNDFMRLFWANHHFHLHFAGCSKNDYLIRALKAVRNEVNRLTFLSFNSRFSDTDDFRRYNQSVLHEHSQLIDYLRKKDIDNLKKTLDMHIQGFQQRVVAYLTS